MMIGTELINEFVETIIYTGFLKDDPPQSTMLIASPESGKTSVVSSKQVRSVLICSDMIGSGLLQELSGKPYVRHIIVNDMIAVMAHKPVTNQRTWAVMSALMEEGLGKQIMPGELSRDFGGRRGGFICCIPSELVSDQRRWWNSSGFTSRTIPFNYEYSEDLLIRIKKEIIIPGAYEQKNGLTPFKTPSKLFAITIAEKEAIQIQKIADKIGGLLGEKGIRRGKQMRALVRAHALRESRTVVNDSDVLFLHRIKDHISYDITSELKVPGMRKSTKKPEKTPRMRGKIARKSMRESPLRKEEE